MSRISALISSKSEEVVEVVEVVDEEAGVELLTVQNLIRFHTLFENTWSTKSLDSVYIKCWKMLWMLKLYDWLNKELNHKLQ